MKFNIYKVTTIGLATLVVATIFANPFKGSVPPRSFDLAEESSIPVQRAPASLSEPVVARQFYPAPAQHPFDSGSSFQNASVSNLHYDEPQQIPDYSPPSSGMNSIAFPPAASAPSSYRVSGPSYSANDSAPAKTEAKKSDDTKTNSTDDSSPSNSAVGSYGGLPTASASPGATYNNSSNGTTIAAASAPTAVNAVGEPGAVALTWVAATGDGAITYTVERSLSATSGFVAVAYGLSGTSYTDNTAINGTLYYYRVRSLNSTGGSYSDVISAFASDLPTTPTLTLVASNGSASLSWTSSTGVGPITYSVERSTTPGVGYGVVTAGLSTPIFSDASATNGTLFYYRIQAHNTAGASGYSPEIAAKAIASFTMGTATAGIQSTAVTWNSATGATQYDVKYGTATGVYTTTLTNKTSSFTVPSLTGNTNYFFSITASNAYNGLTVSTNELSAKPLGAFTITSVTPTDIGKLKFVWAASAGATSYDISCGTTTGDYSALTVTNQTSPATISSLSNATTYYCTVTAKNATGSGNATTEANATTFSLLTYLWPFDAGTDAAYSFDSSKLELVGGMSRLKNATPTDASFVGNDFKDALFSGIKWDSANSKATLDPASDDGELNSQWTPQYNKIVGYWKLNGTANSAIEQGYVMPATVGKNLVAHASGATFQNAVQRQGVLKDANSHFVGDPTSANVSADITVQLWAKTTATTVQVPMAKYYGAGDHGWELVLQTDGTIGFDGRTGTSSYQSSGHSTTPINDGKWHHVVGSRQGGTFKIFIDGKLESSTANDSGSFASAAPLVLGGQDENNTTYAFIGAMDEAAVWNSALSPAEVKTIYERQHARYTGTILSRVMSSGQTTSWAGVNYLTNLPYGKELPNSGVSESRSQYPSMETTALSGAVAYWKFDETSAGTASGGGDFYDGSLHGWNGTKSNGFNSVAGKIGNAQSFNGTNQFIDAGTFNSLNGGSAVTVSGWVKQNVATASIQEVVRNESQIAFQLVSGKAQFFINNSSIWIASGETPAIFNDLQWHFLVGRYDGNLLQVYVDGTLQASTTVGAQTLAIPTNRLFIGSTTGSSEFFYGSLDEIAIYNRALSAGEITSLYQMNSNLMVGNVALYHLNETSGTTAADSSSSARTGTFHGAVTLATSGKFGNSVRFNGDITQSMTASDAGLPSGIQPRTVSMWAFVPQLDDISQGTKIREAFQYGTYSSGQMTALAINNNNWYFSQHGGALLGGPVIPNQWQHIVATFDGTIWSIYVDGVLGGSASLGTNTVLGGGILLGQGGGGASYVFTGSLDEVGIWNRVLSANEIKQLYQRGANRILMQARTCANADCSDDPTGTNWRGSSSSPNSYLSEINNTTSSSPQFLFTNFGYSLTNQPFFQYRAILESDSSSVLPDLTSVSAGPARYDGSSPIVIPVDGPKFQIYTGLTITLGSSCTAVPKLQLSHDKVTWYYYATGMWNVASGGITQANDSATINTNMGTFTNVAGVGELYAKIFYPSNTSTECEINSISVAGADSSSTNSTNPGAFAVTSVSPSNGAVTVSWTAASGSTSYKVCYGTTQALANACATYTTVTGTSTTVSALTNDTPYYFIIQASNGSGITASNLPVYTTPMAAPSVPSTLVATNGLEVNNLTWTASTGSGVITYNIKRGTTSGSYTTIATGVTTNAYSDTSATPGTPYFYVVSASNAGGTSANSNEVTSTAMSIVRYSWNFDYGTDSSYTFDSSKIELSSTGLGRLANRTPTDSSYLGNDFKAALFSGIIWDSVNSKMTLDSSSDDGELNSHWTPKYDQITAYWKLNGTSGNTVANGAVLSATIGPDMIAKDVDSTMKFVGAKQNQGVAFDGVKNALTTQPVALLGTSDDMTLSAWIKPSATQAMWSSVIDWDHCGGRNFILQHNYTDPGVYNFAFWASDSTFKQSQFNLASDQWQHVMITKSGATVKIFVNGEMVSNTTHSTGTIVRDNNYPLMLGESYSCPSRPFSGSLDEVAVWKTGLTSSDVKNIYERQRSRFTGTILSRVMSSGASTSWAGLSYLTTLPYGKELLGNQMGDSAVQYSKSNYFSPSGLKAYWKLDEAGPTYSDSTGNGPSGTASGGYTSVTGKLNRGVHFDGSGSIDLANPSQLPSGTASRTACFWANADTLPMDGSYHFAFGYGTNTTGNAFTIGTQNNHFTISNWGSQVAFSNTVTAGTWNHICTSWDGSQLKLYFNGALDTTTSALPINTPLSIAVIGRQLAGGQAWVGSIDEVGVWDRVLPLAEIQQQYQMNSSLMTNNVGLWHLNETSGTTFADSSGSGNTGTLTGGTTLAAAGKLGNAISVDGTGYITVVPNAALQSATDSNFTFSTWVNLKNLPTTTCATATATCISAVFGRVGYETALEVDNWGHFTANIYNSTNTRFQATSPLTYPSGEWHQLAMSVDDVAKKLYLYIDGTLIANSSYTGTLKSYGSTNYYFGVQNPASGSFSYYLNGSIDETAVWSRQLSTSEINQLYQRGANRIKIQARTCSTANCSDDPNDLNWRGSGNNNTSYFSENDNRTAGVQNSAAPSFNFADFGVSLATNPFFQYRAILQSDHSALLPDLTLVSAGPARFDGSKPTIIPVNGPKLQVLSSFNAILGSAGCSGTPKFQLSPDKNTWYYYSGGWITAGTTADISKANDSATINTNIPSFNAVLGNSNLYVRTYLPSDTTTACEIDSITVQGGHTNPSNSTNPTSFQITSVTGQNGQAIVTWAAATGATGYTVCYGTTQAQADACTLTYDAGASTSATIGSLTNNTQYYFNVVATNGSGRSPASVPASGVPVPLPSTPTSLVATSSAMSINLTWDAIAGASSYTIMRGTSAGSLTAYASGITSNAYTDLMAGSNTTYYYSVRSVNASGSSTDSNIDSATGIGSFSVSLDTPPSAYNGKIILKWTAAAGATSYKVKYGTASGMNTIDLSTQTSPLTISGLTNETTYYILVTAYNAKGKANAQNELSATPWLYPNISINNTTLNQGGMAQFTVSLDQASLHSIIFQAATSNGSAAAGTDYTARTKTVTIPAGQTSTTFAVQTTTETTAAGATRNFSTTLSSIQNALLSGSGIGVATLIDPSFSLDLTSETLDSRVNFSRGSAGTYFDVNGVMQISGANLARYSEDFTNAVWGKGDNNLGIFPTVAANAGIAPDGSNTASFIGVPSGVGGFLYQDVPVTSGKTYSVSLWIKGAAGETASVNVKPCSNYAIAWAGGDYTFNGSWQQITLNGIVPTENCLHFNVADGINQARMPSGEYLWGANVNEGTHSYGYTKTLNSPAYLPRIDHDPITHVSKGLMIEGQATNSLLYSQHLQDTSFWTHAQTTAVGDAIAAPDGTTTATKIVEDSSNNDHALLANGAISVADIHAPLTFSIYLKAGEKDKVELMLGNQNYTTGAVAYADLSLGIIFNTGSFGSTTLLGSDIQNVGNGWYRVSITGQLAAAESALSATVYFNGGAYVGDGTSGFYAWGAQLENNRGMTSYIPTTTGNSTRSADVATLNTLSWYDQANGGTVALDSISTRASDQNARTLEMILSSGNVIWLEIRNLTQSALEYYNGSFNLSSTNEVNPNTVTKQVAAISNNFMNVSSNGNVSSTLTTPLSNLTAVNFSRTTEALNGTLRQFVYYSKLMDTYAQKALSVQTDRSCQTLLDAGNVTSGIYTIKPDGINSTSVYCDMTTDGGGWTLVGNQNTAGGYFGSPAEALSKNTGTPTANLYSILNQLEKFRKNGVFTMKINWPGYTPRNIWSQTSNPTYQAIAGYTGISIQSSDEHWGGLELNNEPSAPSLIDGSVSSSNWYYAFGSYTAWQGGGLPASDTVAGMAVPVPQVQVWVK